jgi:hypothetical protein
MTAYIPNPECKHRGLYRILARNLRIGVYDFETGGFLGIREKFGSRFVFAEYHWDNGQPYGTVKPLSLLPGELPSEIETSERLPGYLCTGNYPEVGCLRLLKEEADEKFYHEHLDGVPCAAGEKVRGGYRHNEPLLKWLEEMEAQHPFALQWCNKEG